MPHGHLNKMAIVKRNRVAVLSVSQKTEKRQVFQGK